MSLNLIRSQSDTIPKVLFGISILLSLIFIVSVLLGLTF